MASADGICMMLELPDDSLNQIALYLPAPDILSWVCVSRQFRNRLDESLSFWTLLWKRDSFDDSHGIITNSNNNENQGFSSSLDAKRAFLSQAYATHLPVVKWVPVARSNTTNSATRTTSWSRFLFDSNNDQNEDGEDEAPPSPREGHLACMMGNNRVVVTGGYANDHFVHVLNVNAPSAAAAAAASNGPSWKWKSIRPPCNLQGEPSFAYGSSLTALDDHRAVRFGGFQRGGYGGETNEVWLLTLHYSDDSGTDGDNSNTTAQWERIVARNRPPIGRAYHSATLIQGRYLFIVGGMMTNRSILEEAILDVQTWTWMERPTFTVAESVNSAAQHHQEPAGVVVASMPSGRHGHSMVLDACRNRLVLFGGGSGSDLLRSGNDNTEVWELQMGEDWQTDLEASLPWTWKLLHADQCQTHTETAAAEAISTVSTLAPAEQLCLGRCHAGVKVAPNTVLFAFGSGRPSTNGVLGYDLRKNIFLHPRVQGPLPKPRFTAAAVYLPHMKCLLVHSGYCSQQGDCLDDVVMLDVAPAVERSLDRCVVVNPRPVDNEVVTDEMALEGRQFSADVMLEQLFGQLAAARPEQRRPMANNMLETLLSSHGGGVLGTRAAIWMSLVANGSAELNVLGDDDDDDDNDDDDDRFVDDDNDEYIDVDNNEDDDDDDEMVNHDTSFGDDDEEGKIEGNEEEDFHGVDDQQDGGAGGNMAGVSQCSDCYMVD